MLEAYALASHHSVDIRTRGSQSCCIGTTGWAHRQVRDMIRDLLATAAKEGDVRDDVSPDELAS